VVGDALASAGLKVVVVDKRGPAKGSTTASTALVQYEIDTPLTKLTRQIGKVNAFRAWRRSRLAVDALAARLTDLNDPDVMPRNSLFLAGNELNKDDLASEHDARRSAGLASLYLDRKSLRSRFGISGQAAILSFVNFVINPRKSTMALLRAAAARGANIFAPVEIVDLEAKETGFTAFATDGRLIHCRSSFLRRDMNCRTKYPGADTKLFPSGQLLRHPTLAISGRSNA
jgi:glycine/D-amino acid oxidase-like deaminating enzyme